MTYVPLLDEIDDGERSMLARLAPIGIDGLTTQRELVARHGQRSYHGVWDVVTLPETRAFTSTPLALEFRPIAHALDVPPWALSVDWIENDDARANFAYLERELGSRLGAPRVADVSNALQREWRFGAFTVWLRAFPPELQPPALAKNNVLHAREPRLVHRASIAIDVSPARPLPDASLVGVDVGALVVEPTPLATRTPSIGDGPIHALRNPRALAEKIRPGTAIAWTDGERIGISVAARSIVVARAPDTQLVLTRLAPARGAGSSTIGVGRSSSPLASTTFLHGADMRSLDALHVLLGAHWGLDLAIVEGLDD